MKLKDESDYSTLFGSRTKMVPRDIKGRGLLKHDIVHEFQTANIVNNEDELNDYLIQFIANTISKNNKKAEKIPLLPEIVRLENVNKENITINNIPIGIIKQDLEVAYIDYLTNIGNIITSNRLSNTIILIKSLIKILFA